MQVLEMDCYMKNHLHPNTGELSAIRPKHRETWIHRMQQTCKTKVPTNMCCVNIR